MKFITHDGKEYMCIEIVETTSQIYESVAHSDPNGSEVFNETLFCMTHLLFAWWIGQENFLLTIQALKTRAQSITREQRRRIIEMTIEKLENTIKALGDLSMAIHEYTVHNRGLECIINAKPPTGAFTYGGSNAHRRLLEVCKVYERELIAPLKDVLIMLKEV